MAILRLVKVCKNFISGQDTLSVLNGIDFELDYGECVALVAPSGSGKSTFLQIAATLDNPTSGFVWINGQNINELSDDKKSTLRSKYLGFVYQFHNLLPDFTSIENVMLPLLICGVPKNEVKARATCLLEQMGLKHRLNHKPSQLSGGEQQRVSIARALVNKPKIIFADEPTGNLDPITAIKIFDLLMYYVAQYQCGLIMATHNLELAQKLSKQITLKNGKIVEIDK